MNPAKFTKEGAGKLLGIGQEQWAFLPNPLPPKLEITWELAERISDADRSLGELAGVARTIPNPHLLIEPFTRREAVLSSRIEGTQATLTELFSAEAGARKERPSEAIREISNYVNALEYGLRRLKQLPVSLRLIKELHERLMKDVRGESLSGEFRRAQNFIGPPGCKLENATYVPPPVPDMKDALDRFEKYLHESRRSLPPLVRLSLIHYQFEAIHPFWDGNGRVGRLLITLLLCSESLLPQPLLYLSAYFERNRKEYYRFLLDISQTGNWTDWLRFFVNGVSEESRDAVARSNQLLALRQEYREKLQAQKLPGRTLELMENLFKEPVITVASARDRLKVTTRAAQQNIDRLVQAGILREVTGRQRYRIFVAQRIIQVVEADQATKQVSLFRNDA
ncbi:MAG: Fic family protein [Candidatus Sulfotelmatobacter sp.]